MKQHWLEVRLRFRKDEGYVGYYIVDAGYDEPKAKVWVTKGRGRLFHVLVKDEGLDFDRYAEYALNEYEKWKKKYDLFCPRGVTRTLQKKWGRKKK